MQRLNDLSGIYQKRTLRVIHGQTQATPYAGFLNPALRNTDGSFRPPVSADSTPVDYTVNTFTYQNGLLPGTCMIIGPGEAFLPSGGLDQASGAVKADTFGLLANFVGGNFDDLKTNNEIGVWYGPGSVYEVLFPAFNDTGLATAYAAATPGVPVPLYAGADGRLCTLNSGANGLNNSLGNRRPVAELIERRNGAVIMIKLLV